MTNAMKRLRAFLARGDIRYLSILAVPAFVAALLLTSSGGAGTTGDTAREPAVPLGADTAVGSAPAASDDSVPPTTAKMVSGSSGGHGGSSGGNGSSGGSNSGSDSDSESRTGSTRHGRPPAVTPEVATPAVLVVAGGIAVLSVFGITRLRKRSRHSLAGTSEAGRARR